MKYSYANTVKNYVTVSNGYFTSLISTVLYNFALYFLTVFHVYMYLCTLLSTVDVIP